MRARIGWWLRRLADRIDHEHAPRATGWSFTLGPFGIAFNDMDRGCPVWYLEAELESYERARAEGAGQ